MEDLKASVEQARRAPEGKGDTMSLYGTSYNQCICLRIDYVTGLGSSSLMGPTLVGEVATIFLDTLYKALFVCFVFYFIHLLAVEAC